MLSRKELANAIRVLSMDAVQKAQSGHPGMPMGMADIAEVLWNDFLKHNPQNPHWFNRDRFILSNGHGSLLQYALLHLTGYDVSLSDLMQFRQLGSKTPGHPEVGVTPGVETTSGPLGQGFANAVGMALAEQMLASTFNRPGFSMVDHVTYCFVGDGCLMEGISHEVGSLAGTLGLGKLIVFWDDNGISIDGKVAPWFSENTAARFRAYGWHVIEKIDGHNPLEIRSRIEEARKIVDKPCLLCCQTTIGFGAPTLAGTEKTHGQPLGEKEVEGTRKNLNWPYPPFVIPEEIYHRFDAKEKGKAEESKWHDLFHNYKKQYPDLAIEFQRRMQGTLPPHFEEKLQNFIAQTEMNQTAMATRKASQQTLHFLVELLPELLGGSADLSESNLTHTPHSKPIQPHHFNGNYIYYGVREFGMSAIMNGVALHQGFIPYGGTFLVFLDYARNAVRMAALMKQRVIFVYTHDSIGLGEDGPTHQPIEHLSMLRTTANMSVWRPCDATETAVAWKMAIERKTGPTSLCLTRQTVPAQKRTELQCSLIEKGGYILWEAKGPLDAILIATGSEVSLAVASAQTLQTLGKNIRVVSMPCVDQFEKQDETYRNRVLPKSVSIRVAIEAGTTAYWYRWVGSRGKVIGINCFGESAKAEALFHHLGLTEETVCETVLALLEQEVTNDYSVSH